MNVWNKVLYCLIAVLCVAFGVLAANKYSLTKSKNEELAKLQKDLADVKEAVAQLKAEVYGAAADYDGDWQTLSLNARLDCVRSLKRGETFSNCRPVDASTSDGQTTISVVVPDDYVTTSFRSGAIAYVFDSGLPLAADDADAASDAESSVAAQPARFLGAFNVSAVNGAQASLVSAESVSEAEATATTESAQSGRAWIVCLNAGPIDSPDDLAAIAKDNPEMFAPYGAELQAYFAKSNVVAEQTAAASDEDGETTVATASIPQETETTRFPVNYLGGYYALTQYSFDEKTNALTKVVDPSKAYVGVVDLQWTRRDAQNTLKTRNQITLARFTDIFFDQLVAIENIDQATVDAADAKVQALYTQENYDALYAAAEKRKLSASYAEQQAELEIAAQKMVAQRDLVKAKLDEALAAVEKCQESIEATILENAELAAKLARTQILVAEKIEREAARRTASNDVNFSLRNGI